MDEIVNRMKMLVDLYDSWHVVEGQAKAIFDTYIEVKENELIKESQSKRHL